MIVACTKCKSRFEAAGYRDVTCPSCGSIAQQATTRPCVLKIGFTELGQCAVIVCRKWQE